MLVHPCFIVLAVAAATWAAPTGYGAAHIGRAVEVARDEVDAREPGPPFTASWKREADIDVKREADPGPPYVVSWREADTESSRKREAEAAPPYVVSWREEENVDAAASPPFEASWKRGGEEARGPPHQVTW
ncbi:hypothetical protein V5O48_015891 [Marasmius crinis-equi]|uniref:Uncharacterized protein n=1 Tax=Marasmius crinis-equi TaxID=585013 RepID=A0ABR3ETE0_9AGAR